jgi:hypothetical protein
VEGDVTLRIAGESIRDAIMTIKVEEFQRRGVWVRNEDWKVQIDQLVAVVMD